MHGINLEDKSWINIMLECIGKTINFEVRNSIHLSAKNETAQEKSGVGLKNVLQRLHLVQAGMG